MQASQFSDEQIVQILQEAGRGDQSIGAICRAHDITATTCYRWRRTFGGMTVSQVQRLKELEKEHARLKCLLAERDLDIDAHKELITTKRSVWRRCARRDTSWLIRGSRRSGPARCASASGPRSTTRLGLTATRPGSTRYANAPRTTHAMATDGSGHVCAGSEWFTQSGCTACGSGAACRLANVRASADVGWHLARADR